MGRRVLTSLLLAVIVALSEAKDAKDGKVTMSEPEYLPDAPKPVAPQAKQVKKVPSPAERVADLSPVTDYVDSKELSKIQKDGDNDESPKNPVLLSMGSSSTVHVNNEHFVDAEMVENLDMEMSGLPKGTVKMGTMNSATTRMLKETVMNSEAATTAFLEQSTSIDRTSDGNLMVPVPARWLGKFHEFASMMEQQEQFKTAHDSIKSAAGFRFAQAAPVAGGADPMEFVEPYGYVTPAVLASQQGQQRFGPYQGSAMGSMSNYGALQPGFQNLFPQSALQPMGGSLPGLQPLPANGLSAGGVQPPPPPPRPDNLPPPPYIMPVPMPEAA